MDNGLYQLGMRLLELGSLVKGRLNVREAAVSAMRSLHKLTGQTINLSVQQGDEIVTSSGPGASAPACRWCAPSAAARRCT